MSDEMNAALARIDELESEIRNAKKVIDHLRVELRAAIDWADDVILKGGE